MSNAVKKIEMSKTRKLKKRSRDADHLPPKQSRLTRTDISSCLCFHSPASLFESLVQPIGEEQFFAEYWEKKPLHLERSNPSTASYYKSLFQLSDLHSLCTQGLEYYRDVNVVRCINGKKKVLNKEGQVDSTVLSRNLVENKATIQFHQPQRFKDELWRIQEKLECYFGALVGSNVYITPQDSQGLPVHYDDVEVFILQLEGEKHWLLYSPTVPLATEYSVESKERIGKPILDVILKAGDLLYFPRGTIHQASTPAGVEHSIHLTISTYQKMSWGDLLMDVFPSLLSDASKTEVSLREGMPTRLLLGEAKGLDTSRQLATGLRFLADKIETGTLEARSNQMKRDFIMNRLPPYNQQLLKPSDRVPVLEDVVCLRCKDHMIITVEPSNERTDETTELVVFVLHSLKNQRESHMMRGMCDEEEEHNVSWGLQFPLSHLQALQQLLQAEKLAVAQLPLPTDESKRNLAVALWSENLLDVL